MEAQEKSPGRHSLDSQKNRTDVQPDTSSFPHESTERNGNGSGEAAGTLYDNIPAELKALPQWVVWKLVSHPDGKKPKKVPVNPVTGGAAAVNDPQSWGTFAQAVDAVALDTRVPAASRYGLAGIGFMFTRDDPYAGIDLDGCRDPQTGSLNPFAHDTMQRVVSYTEASPSGKGLHIIAKGTLPAGGAKNGTVEMYDTGRYFTFTGEHLGGTPVEIQEQSEAVDALYREQFPEKLKAKAHPQSTGTNPPHTPLSDEEVLAKATGAKNGAKVQALLAGELAGYPSASEAEMALCNQLAFYCGPDSAEQIDRIIRHHLKADRLKKWDEIHFDNGETYGQHTVMKALEGRTEFYHRSARPTIQITTDITTVVNEAEHALLALPHGPHLFQRIDALCFISHTKRAPKWLARESGAPSIVACSPAQLRERMSQAADWVKWVARSEEWAPALPPAWAVETLHGRQDWNFSVLTDVVSSPTLGEDGAIICTPGYDLDTGLFLDTQGVLFPPIPEQPTLDEAVRAVAALRNPFADFPFAGEDGKSAALSAILSLVARPAIDGCVPLFAVDSTTRGTGKGLLIDVVSTIATGRFAPRWAQSPDGEEDRKRLLTIAIAGDACVHIDNLTHPLGTGPLDSAITSRVIKDRLLGLNRVVEAPFNCVLFASGNNISYAGDMARRVVPIHLESLEEHPENRDDFQHPRLLAWVRQERPRLVVEALTILRAYFVAGCPKQGIPALGSFEEWSDLVRSALIWAGCPDPCEGRKTLEAEADPGYENLAQLLHCWAACYGSKAVTLSSVIGDVGQRSADMSVRINTANEWNELGEALAAFDPRFDGKRLDVKRIGIGLRAIKGRVLGPYRLIQVGKSQGGVALWALQQV